MILSVNGKADLPSLLIHDSPREADLDAGIYSNLFDFALSLEEKVSPPPSQYIITTTTAPLQITADHHALRLKLSSTPPESRLTGIADNALLRASHIRPWRDCETDDERLDVHNGFLLSALWDAAFDNGLVAFDPDGIPIFSERLSKLA